MSEHISTDIDLTALSTAVATLSAQMVSNKELMIRIEDEQKTALKDIKAQLTKIDETLNGKGGHVEWINARKRDGWWLSGALVGLSFLLTAFIDWVKG